jgi:hypothetical protein
VLFLKLAILLLLTIIFIQDLVSRSVYWIIFPLLAALYILTRILIPDSGWGMCESILLNIGFLALQLLLVTVYFSIKNKQFVNITADMLGWGDILFLLSTAFYLSTLNFIFFYLFSLILVLLSWIIWQIFSKGKKIPLAGLQSLIFALFLASGWWLWHLDITKDDWLLQLLIKWT